MIAKIYDSNRALPSRQSDVEPEPLPRDTPGVARLEGELVTQMHTGYQVFFLNDCELSEVLAFQLNVPKNAKHERDFGRVRITIEPLRE